MNLNHVVTAGLVLAALASLAFQPPTVPVDRETAIAALKEVHVLVGDWKGAAQPKRGSNAGAWTEKAHAAWDFADNHARLVVTFEPDHQFQSAAFVADEDGKSVGLVLQPQEGDPARLVRVEPSKSDAASEASLIFESPDDVMPRFRCTVRVISDIRIAMLFEEQPATGNAFRRMYEAGLTRAGERLASGNTGERECIVTGGLGTIKVMHDGKTFYVCCEGCKQAFDADPQGTIDAYRERLKSK